MNARNTALTALVVLCSVQGGWLLSGWLAPDARAEDPYTTESTAAPYPGRLLCKTFAVDPDDSSMELPSDSSAAGRWARDQGERWQIYTVDLEIGQKPTGYPQQWMQVCLYPR
jgi:hypothetical protein